MIVTSVALGVRYIQYLPRFSGFLSKHGLKAKVRISEDDHSVRKALRAKCNHFVRQALPASEPVLALDVDGVMHSFPSAFNEIRHADFAAVRSLSRNGTTWEVSTLLAFPTETAKRTLELWDYYMDRDDWTMDCDVFSAVVHEKTHAVVFDLPVTYGWVDSWHRNTYGNQSPVIEYNLPLGQECAARK